MSQEENKKYMEKEGARMAMVDAIDTYIQAAKKAGFPNRYIVDEIKQSVEEVSDGKIEL